jgi:hypothetical protein
MAETDMRGAAVRRDLHLAAELLEMWRLCGKSHCRRARACRGDTSRCCGMLADWYEVLKLKDKRVSFAEAMWRLREQSAQPTEKRGCPGQARA